MEHRRGVRADVHLALVQRPRPTHVRDIQDVEVANAVRSRAGEDEAPLADEVEGVEGPVEGGGPADLDNGPRRVHEAVRVELAGNGLRGVHPALAAEDEELVVRAANHLVAKSRRRRLPRALRGVPSRRLQADPTEIAQNRAVVRGADTTVDKVQVALDARAVQKARRRRLPVARRRRPCEALRVEAVHGTVGGPAVRPGQAAGERRRTARPAVVRNQASLPARGEAAEDDEVRLEGLHRVAPARRRSGTVRLQLCPPHLLDFEEVQVTVHLLLVRPTMKVHPRGERDGLGAASSQRSVAMLLQVADREHEVPDGMLLLLFVLVVLHGRCLSPLTSRRCSARSAREGGG
mmetsp:Transcript_10254/g.29162  ORF Transcript_10254/g.29162 Transcript_10254/m.29162 type:complete len:349 (+) Transcript_10254:1096-2142(+)